MERRRRRSSSSNDNSNNRNNMIEYGYVLRLKQIQFNRFVV